MFGAVALALALVALATATPARAEFSIGLAGIDTLSTPSASQPATTYDFSSKSGLGVGIEMQLSVIGSFGLELGVLYATRKYTADVLSQSTGVITINGDTYAIPAVEVPILVTYSPLSWVSVGFGGYFATLVDHVSVTDGPTGVQSNQSLSDTALTNHDYGIAGSLRLLIPIFSLGSSWRLSLLAEGQGLYSLANTAVDSGNTFHYRDLQLLAGVALATF